MNIVGRGFTVPEFEAYVENIKFTGWNPKFVVVHNTSVPSQALYRSWHDRPNWTGEQWMKNLASYYSGMGWKSGPHLFVGYDKIWVFSPLTSRGTHTPSWNSISWGVETIAEFQSEAFDGPVRDNLVAALGILHSRAGLNPADFKLGVSGLHLHKEDKNTSHKGCPGKNLNKQDLIDDVIEYMKDDGFQHPHISEASQTADTSDLTAEELTSVKWLQRKLGVDVDGKIGPQTRAAVRAFQNKSGLEVDGIAGPLTRKALKAI